MGRKSHYNEVIDLIVKEPMTQTEIAKELGLTIPGVTLNLDKGIENRAIAYLGNSEHRKINSKIFVRHYRKDKKWPYDAHQCYVRTPESEKLHQNLIDRFGKDNEGIINEITRFYRAIEIMAKFQEIHLTDLMKKDVQIYYEMRDKIVSFGSNNNDFIEFVKIIEFTPMMHWCTYKNGANMRDLPIPMFQKLRDLFLKVNGINSIVPTDKFDTLNIRLKDIN